MRGKGHIFSKPKEQILMILPMVLSLLAGLAAGVFIFLYIREYTLTMGGATLTIDKIVSKIDWGYRVFIIVLTLLGVIGFLWTWWLSFKIFGPFGRLEKQLQKAIDENTKVEGVFAREYDTLRPFINILDTYIKKFYK